MTLRAKSSIALAALLLAGASLACVTSLPPAAEPSAASSTGAALPGQLTAEVVSIITAGAAVAATQPVAAATPTRPNAADATPPAAARQPAGVFDALIPAGIVNGELLTRHIRWDHASVLSRLRFTEASTGRIYLDQTLRVGEEPFTAASLPASQTPLPEVPTFGAGSLVYATDAGGITVAFFSDRAAVTLAFYAEAGASVPLAAVLPLAQLSADRLPTVLEWPTPPPRPAAAPSSLVSAALRVGQEAALVEPASATFSPGDIVSVLIAAPDEVDGIGYLLWSVENGQYVELQSAYQGRAAWQQRFVVEGHPAGSYELDVAVFAGDAPLAFAVVQTLRLEFVN